MEGSEAPPERAAGLQASTRSEGAQAADRSAPPSRAQPPMRRPGRVAARGRPLRRADPIKPPSPDGPCVRTRARAHVHASLRSLQFCAQP
jgi:hypothetical protein